MAPKKSTKGAAAPANSPSESQDASQDTGLARTFEQRMKAKTAERRETKTASINAAHDGRMTKLRADVSRCFQDHEKELRSLRRPNVEHLMKLTQKKRELEAKIDKCQSELARSIEEASQQLQASINGRVEDLSA